MEDKNPDSDRTHTYVHLTPDLILSHYRIIEKIGEGGMGTVYRGEDTKLRRTVALKFLSPQSLGTPEAKARFLNEARAAAALDHPNICAVHEIDEADGHTFIVMAFIDGQSLRERIKSGPLPLKEAINIGAGIARGLQEAHENGIVHRDIKGANVMLTGKGQVKITDFGLARLEGDTRLTRTGTTMGTAAYMSPEQLCGGAVDHRSDIWSLGVVLYEMITGKLPFRGEQVQALSHQIVQENAQPITAVRTGIPMALERIVSKCLQKDPSNRYQHIDDLLVDLLNYESSPDAKETIKPRARPAIPILFALLSMTLIAVLWKLFLSGNERPIGNPLAGATFSRLVNFEGEDAAISPDGKFVAFVSNRDGPFDVWVAQVGTGNVYNRTRGQEGDVRKLLQDVGFSADGSEIWIGGTPERRMRIMPLLDGQLRNCLKDSVIQADWSPDGNRVVYHTYAAGDPLFVADGDGTNSRKILAADPGGHQHFPTWSLDGQWIYLVRGLDNAWDMDLWRVRPDGREFEKLTEHQRDITFPTPVDENTVLYIALSEDGSGPWLWAVDIETRTSHRASIGLEQYSSLTGSADGRRLVATVAHPAAGLWNVPILDRVAVESDAKQYSLPAVRAQMPRFGGGALYFLSSRGTGDGLWRYREGQLEEIWNGSKEPLFEAPAVSPDGKRVALVLRRDNKLRLYLLNSDGSTLRGLSGEIDVRGTATWSPDGQWLAIGGSDADGRGLFKFPVNGNRPERIADGDAANPVWSPNGKIIIYAGKQVNAVTPLLAIDPDGNAVDFPGIQVLANGHRFRFLPDGSGLVYMKGVRASQDFWLLDLATGKSRQLTELSRGAEMLTFDVAPDGKSIMFDRLRDNSEVVLIDLARHK